MVLVEIFFSLTVICFGVMIVSLLAGGIGTWRNHPIATTFFEASVDCFNASIIFAALTFIGLLFV